MNAHRPIHSIRKSSTAGITATTTVRSKRQAGPADNGLARPRVAGYLFSQHGWFLIFGRPMLGAVSSPALDVASQLVLSKRVATHAASHRAILIGGELGHAARRKWFCDKGLRIVDHFFGRIFDISRAQMVQVVVCHRLTPKSLLEINRFGGRFAARPGDVSCCVART